MVMVLSAQTVITDRQTYAEPLAPALPAAGGTVVDPTFGTTILRATDAVDGKDCIHPYSFWPSFNLNSTAFFAGCDNNPILYHFDPVAFKILSKEPLYTAPPAPGYTWLAWQDAYWSSRDPNVLYSHEGPRIWSYNVATKSYGLVKDFGTELADGALISRMTVSTDDNTFAFTRCRSDYTTIGFAVWKRDVNRIVAKEGWQGYHKVQIDKTGRFLLNTLQSNGAGVIQSEVYDTATGKVDYLTDNGPDFAPGHGDLGRGISVAYENWQNRILSRNLATPHSWTVVLDLGNDWSQESHHSLLSDDESYLTVSHTSQQGTARTNGLFHNEIFQVATDGSGKMRRLGHHRSLYRDYYDSPRANISRDGRFVVFTSNWGTSKRDVFILKVPPATQPPAESPATPPPPSAGVSLSSIALDYAVRPGGLSNSVYAYLAEPAPKGGVQVNINSSNPALAAFSGFIPEGRKSERFSLVTQPVSSTTEITIVVAAGGVTKSATLTLVKPWVTGVSFDSPSVKGGTPLSVYVYLNGPAPSGGVAVTLKSSHSAVSAGSGTIAPGAVSGRFFLNTEPVSSTRDGELTISTGDRQISAAVTVKR